MMTWKLLWQLLFIVGFLLFNLIFVIFSIRGYRELKDLLRGKDE